MDIFHLCHYLTFTVCTVWHSIHTVRSSVTATYVQQNACSRGTVGIEHIYWDDTFLLKMTHIITWCSALLCRTSCMIHPQWLLPPPNKHNAGNNKNNGYHLVTHQYMLPSMPSLPLTLHAMLWYSVLFLSSPCSNSNIHKQTTKNSTWC